MGSAIQARDRLVERLSTASLGMGEVMTVYLGEKLGLYRALVDQGAQTSSVLAEQRGISERYAREWLEQQAAAGIIEVDDASGAEADRRYSLPEGHREPLLDPDSPYSIAPICKSFVAMAGAMPDLLEAFRRGTGVGWEAYGRDMIEAQGDFNRPWLVGALGSEYMPSVVDIHERLTADPPARVADIACGVGWASIALARAYPKIAVDGFDLDELSIELAGANAKEAGVSDRVRFEARDAADPDLQGSYDLALVVEAIHDLSDPVGVLRAIRVILKQGAPLIVADERTEEAFTAPASETERLFYIYSVLCCLPAGMADRPSAATGTVMRRATFERYAREAGFTRVEVLPIEHDFLRFYRLER